ncbi:structural maintenance of chromosomes protein, partial [Haematococcus lacustris]
GERLKKAKAQVAKAQKEVQEAEGEGAKRGVQLKANTKQADKLRRDVAKEEKEVENIKAELTSLLQSLDDLTEQAVKVEELVEATKEQMTKKQSELESAGAEHTRITTHHAVVRKAEMDIEAALEHLDKLHRDESHKIQIWLGEIDKLQAQLLTLTGGEAYMVDADSLAGQKAEDFMFKAQVYEADLEKMSVDLSAIEQWRLKAADYAQRAAELDAVTQEREEVRRGYEGLRKSRLDEFMAGFNIISLKLKEMYGANASKWVVCRESWTVRELLSRPDHVVPGVPLLFALAKGSAYRQRFLEKTQQ